MNPIARGQPVVRLSDTSWRVVQSLPEHERDLVAYCLHRYVEAGHTSGMVSFSIGSAVVRTLFRKGAVEAIEVELASTIKPLARREPLDRLSGLTDWVPSRIIRKRLHKLIADDATEILHYRRQGRTALARWRAGWTWIHWLRYVLTGPVTLLLSAFRRFIAAA